MRLIGIIILGLIIYIVYDKGLIFNNGNQVEENHNDVGEKEDNLVEQSVPTDFIEVK